MSALKTYPSKIDAWLGALLVLLFGGSVVAIAFALYMFSTAGPTESAWSMLGTGGFVVLIFVVLVWPVRYTLTGEELIVQSGLLKSRYKYDIILGAEPSRNLLSSPALSLDRIKIRYEGRIGFFMISPPDKEAFMKDLASRAAGLEYIQGKVVGQ